jgi:hypothetical protein
MRELPRKYHSPLQVAGQEELFEAITRFALPVSYIHLHTELPEKRRP